LGFTSSSELRRFRNQLAGDGSEWPQGAAATRTTSGAGSILSVESNQKVESNTNVGDLHRDGDVTCESNSVDGFVFATSRTEITTLQ